MDGHNRKNTLPRITLRVRKKKTLLIGYTIKYLFFSRNELPWSIVNWEAIPLLVVSTPEATRTSCKAIGSLYKKRRNTVTKAYHVIVRLDRLMDRDASPLPFVHLTKIGTWRSYWTAQLLQYSFPLHLYTAWTIKA